MIRIWLYNFFGVSPGEIISSNSLVLQKLFTDMGKGHDHLVGGFNPSEKYLFWLFLVCRISLTLNHHDFIRECRLDFRSW